MKNKITILLATVVMFTSVHSMALIVSPNEASNALHNATHCGPESSGNCLIGFVFVLSLLPTYIVGDDGSVYANPELLKAVNEVLRSNNATADEKLQALQRLNEMVK